MELIIIALVAYYIGFKVAEIVHVTSFKKILNDLELSEQQLRDLVKKNGLEFDQDLSSEDEPAAKVEIRVEQHLEQLFVYEVASHRFVTQGASADEIMQRLIEAYPKGTKLVCDPDQGGLILTAAAERLKTQSN